MKMLSLFASLALISFCLSSCEPARATPVQVVKIKVEGMTCPVGCAPQVKQQLESVDGVSKVVVDFEAKQATVETSKQVQEQTLLAALKEPFKGEIVQ